MSDFTLNVHNSQTPPPRTYHDLRRGIWFSKWPKPRRVMFPLFDLRGIGGLNVAPLQAPSLRIFTQQTLIPEAAQPSP